MSHTVIYNSAEHLIEIKVQGDFFLSEAKEMTTNVAQIAKAQNCLLVLNDMREATVKLDMLEIYQLPKIISDIYASFEISVHKVKRAQVVANDLKDYSFYENVSVNRSQQVRYFLDINEAKKWLFEK